MFFVKKLLSELAKIFLSQHRQRLTVVVLLVAGGVLLNHWKKIKKKAGKNWGRVKEAWNYMKLKQMVLNPKNEIKVPCMIVDLDIFDENIQSLCGIANKYGKSLRLATKSIRCPYLIKRAYDKSNGVCQGLMCYSVFEAKLLYEMYGDAFDKNYLIAYPTLQKQDIECAFELTQKDVCIILMIDSGEHIQKIESVCQEYIDSTENKHEASQSKLNPIRLCLDLDMSYQVLGGLFSIGAHRSRTRDSKDIFAMASSLDKCKHVQLIGVMGYEAHIAGVTDNNPFFHIPSCIVQALKLIFWQQCRDKRQKLIETLQSVYSNYPFDSAAKTQHSHHGHDHHHHDHAFPKIDLKFVNGGGTGLIFLKKNYFYVICVYMYMYTYVCVNFLILGNLEMSCKDVYVTEVTAGSGLIQSQIFDYFVSNNCLPAACFALQVTRIHSPTFLLDRGFICCQSGGFIASGNISLDKQPVTPLSCKNPLFFDLGDPIFVRSAKAGEIAEHFTHYILKHNSAELFLVDQNDLQSFRVPTYRGLGHVFY
ncbi:putative amino acid aldolase or racemase [Reticulomyxa filosa]|uniref:Putative amino acid aldolase or racemase n=1 Tax=Reticulomyxa filosa TaxID=46433 RepID=X6MA70_RETFI|nr:putative amino acid aldolase or racemase [Reticulomyxa filosa]|eukprot:ETO10566.1 putative amino acid aldolase or racemase [Reticulomyxa filosa]